MRQLDQTAAGRLDRLLSAAPDPVGVAVSGGSDSLAMLSLAHDWARRNGRRLLVLTVDHGLRSEARQETDHVATVADRHGLDHRILKWGRPVAVQARARQARHGLLAAALREAGGAALLTGHTLDDQRETFLIRARQGSGWYGLGGLDAVAPSPSWPRGRGVTLVRPLLGERRRDLREHLLRAGLGWCEDRSNDDPRFERVRVRHLLAQAPQLSGRVDRVQARLARLRRARQRHLAKLAESRVTAQGDATVRVEDHGLDGEVRRQLVASLVQIAAGTDRPPRGPRLDALLEAFPPGETAPGRTLGGAWIWRVPDALYLARDPGAGAEVRMEDDVWDGRFLRDGDAPELSASTEVMGRRSTQPPDPGTGWRSLLSDRLAHQVACWRGTPFG